MMVSKTLIKKHKDNVNDSISNLRHNVDECSIETAKSLGRLLYDLKNAVRAGVLEEDEEDSYINNIALPEVERFERHCRCNKSK